MKFIDQFPDEFILECRMKMNEHAFSKMFNGTGFYFSVKQVPIPLVGFALEYEREYYLRATVAENGRNEIVTRTVLIATVNSDHTGVAIYSKMEKFEVRMFASMGALYVDII